MQKLPTNRRFWELMGGIFLVMLAFAIAAGGGSFLFSSVIGLFGFYLLVRQFDKTARALPADRQRRDSAPVGDLFEDELLRQPGMEQVYRHAVKAVERAGLSPAETQVLPVDIGLMVFSGDQEPTIFRAQPIPDDVDYVQPFVQLRLPRRAVGRVRFEILDSDRQVIFIHEDRHQLERGRNLISPAARLPIHDAQAMHGSWELRISADGTLLAAHRFDWVESTNKVIRRQLSADGEISSEMRAMLSDNRLQGMSLDELLEGQEREQRQQRR